MANNGLTKSYVAESAIVPFSLIKYGAADYGAAQGAAATDKLYGVSTEVASAIGERFDVILEGIADLKINGVVARGDFITSDATGLGITAAPAVGVNNRIIGIAQVSGVAGDIIPVQLQPGSVQG